MHAALCSRFRQALKERTINTTLSHWVRLFEHLNDMNVLEGCQPWGLREG